MKVYEYRRLYLVCTGGCTWCVQEVVSSVNRRLYLVCTRGCIWCVQEAVSGVYPCNWHLQHFSGVQT